MYEMVCVKRCTEWVYQVIMFFFFFKQKTAYEMRISDWSSDVCSSDLPCSLVGRQAQRRARLRHGIDEAEQESRAAARKRGHGIELIRSGEHTSELQSLMRISYAVFCLKKKIRKIQP